MWELTKPIDATRFGFRASRENLQVLLEWPQVATCNYPQNKNHNSNHETIGFDGFKMLGFTHINPSTMF